MKVDPVELSPCPDCGHFVYRPLVAPIRHQQSSCRAVLSDDHPETARCGCGNVAHRLPTTRPRHRLEPGPASSTSPSSSGTRGSADSTHSSALAAPEPLEPPDASARFAS